MSDSRAIRTEVIFSGFSSRVDGSLGFRGNTPELTVPEKVAMMGLQGLLCEMLVFPKEEKEAELIEVKKEMEHKSPSARMRSIIWLIWKQEAEKQMVFEQFYQTTMENLIAWLKKKLPADEAHSYR
jgi:hypothetical protein